MTLDYATWLQAAAALAGVLLLALLAARLARGTARLPGRRLRVEEAVALDARRRLVLIRCDGREGLVLIGEGAGWVGWLPPDGGAPRDGGGA